MYIRRDISLMRERIVRVICNFKYFRGPLGSDHLLFRGVGWKKQKYSRKTFVEERPQKHQGNKIQAKLLVKKINK